jgi:hypothetical protein
MDCRPLIGPFVGPSGSIPNTLFLTVFRDVWTNVRPARGRDRGEGGLGYLGVMLVAAAIIVGLLGSGIGGRLGAAGWTAVCKALRAGGAADSCDPHTGMPPGAIPRDPDEPTRGCVPRVESRYLEETLTIPTRRIDVRTNSRGTVQMIKRLGPDGRPTWEIWDFTWHEAGLATPETPFGPVKAGAWGGVSINHGKIYGGFGDEAEARRFFTDLEQHRIGNEAKFTLRTNPITGGLVWLGTLLPWVGDDFDRFMGGSDPDRKPTGELLDGALTGGFKVDVEAGRFKVPTKGRGWLVLGSQTNLENGETTTFFNSRAEFEVGLQFDVGDIMSKLPPAVRQRAQQGLEDGVDAVLNVIEGTLKSKHGNDFLLLPEHRAQLRSQIKLNPSIGFNYKHRGGTTWGVTTDRDGNVVRVSQTRNGQDVFYARVDAKSRSSSEGGGKTEAVVGRQWILFAQRTVTEKHMERSDPEARAVIDRYLYDRDTDAVERAWDRGVGTQGRMSYDNTGDTLKAEAKGAGNTRRWGVLEFGRESEDHILQSAHYFKPGQGWVAWKGCR